MSGLGNVVKKITGGLAMGKMGDALSINRLIDMAFTDPNTEALKEQANQQQRNFELQLKQQNEAATLSGSKMLDNVVNVQTGDALAAIDGLTSSKKKRTTEGRTGISSALGVG